MAITSYLSRRGALLGSLFLFIMLLVVFLDLRSIAPPDDRDPDDPQRTGAFSPGITLHPTDIDSYSYKDPQDSHYRSKEKYEAEIRKENEKRNRQQRIKQNSQQNANRNNMDEDHPKNDLIVPEDDPDDAQDGYDPTIAGFGPDAATTATVLADIDDEANVASVSTSSPPSSSPASHDADHSATTNENNNNNKNHHENDKNHNDNNKINNDDELSIATAKRKYPLRYSRLVREEKQNNQQQQPDPSLAEWPHEDELLDQPIYNYSTRKNNNFISQLEWKGKCWYSVTNFCLIKGELVLFHDPERDGAKPKRDSLRMCNEFSQRSPLIRLKYRSEPMPSDVLPAPLLTKTPGWVLQFWCQDLFHSTLSLMPAFHTRFSSSSSLSLSSKLLNGGGGGGVSLGGENKNSLATPEPDIYLRIARGRRKKGQYCHIKYGHPLTYNESHNTRWGGDKQFPFAGNPYWSMYGVLSKDPWRLHPLYSGATAKSACYKRGVIDKLYVKDITRTMAREYSDAMLRNLNVTKAAPRKCGEYRVTIIDRRGKTRRLTNIPAIADIAKKLFPNNFKVVRAVAFEHLTLQQQIRLVTDTDLLLGVHGNGLIWQQFLQQGSCLIELVHVWYMPYAKLFGHSYFHSSIKNNPFYKKNGEYVPFAHNETEMAELLTKAKEALDATSCGEHPVKPDMAQKLDEQFSACRPNC